MSVLPYRLRKLIAVRPGLKLYDGVRSSDGSPALIQHIFPEANRAAREEHFSSFAAFGEGLARCDHESVPSHLFHTGSADDPFYLATEMPAGTGLDALLARVGTLDWRAAVAVLRPVAEALGCAHEAGLTHLALRPDVILLRRESAPVVLELGLAPLLLRTGEGVSGVADPLWPRLFPIPQLVSPELLAVAHGATPDTLDARSDVLSLGVLLFRLVAGRWPYDEGTSIRVYNQVQSGIRDDVLDDALGHLPPELCAVARRATQRDPAKRYAHAGEMAAVLGALDESPSAFAALPRAVAELVRDEPYAARFGELLTVVDGGPKAAVTPDEDEEPDAAAAAERDRQIRLAELQLQSLRNSRRGERGGGVLKWMLLIAIIVAFALTLPMLLERSRGAREYAGGVNPRTGLTHAVPTSSPFRPKTTQPLRRPSEPESVRERRALATP